MSPVPYFKTVTIMAEWTQSDKEEVCADLAGSVEITEVILCSLTCSHAQPAEGPANEHGAFRTSVSSSVKIGAMTPGMLLQGEISTLGLL
jgi:hypothetical protein